MSLRREMEKRIEKKREEILDLIEKESHKEHLTERIEEFLKTEMHKRNGKK